MTNQNIADQLKYITIRILTSKPNDADWSGAGTGFLYEFRNGEKFAWFLITNKHVLAGAIRIGLNFHESIDDNQTPLSGPGRVVELARDECFIIDHPDREVDLAAIALNPIIKTLKEDEGWKPYIKCLVAQNLPSKQMVSDFSALEDVIMVGYPTGLVDEANNFPVARRGITSTPYSSDYQGKREFLADISVFGGSSGSPVFILNEGSFSSKSGALNIGTRFALIGVLYAGHIEHVTGKIVAQPIPTNFEPVPKFERGINLGLCIKSELVEELKVQIPGL